MKKEVYYSSHLEFRLNLREIPYDLPKKVYFEAAERYFDKATGKFVAIKSVRYKNKPREIAVIYEEFPSAAKLITVHPLKKRQKLARIMSGRWQKYEQV